MTVTYLDQLAVAALDGNGNGTATIKPSVGQYWFPTFIQVSTVKQAAPFPYCAVFHTVAGTNPQRSNFVDDTYLANNDTSSIMSGTMVQYGDAIVAQFQGGVPNDTATVRVFGAYSDSPNEAGPVTPGTHFSGRLAFNTDVPLALEQLTAVNLPSSTNTVYYPGGGVNPGIPYQTSRYQSIKAQIHATSPGTKPYYGVEFLWYADPAAQILINAEYFVFSSSNLVFYNEGQGPVRGPYLIIAVTGYDTAVGQFNLNLYGSQRSEPRTQFHSSSFNTAEPFGFDNIIFADSGSLGPNGTHTTYDFNFYNGPVAVNFWTPITPAKTNSLVLQINPQPASVFPIANQFTLSTAPVLSPDAPTTQQMTLPRRVCNGLITNTDTNTLTWHLVIWAQEL